MKVVKKKLYPSDKMFIVKAKIGGDVVVARMYEDMLNYFAEEIKKDLYGMSMKDVK